MTRHKHDFVTLTSMTVQTTHGPVQKPARECWCGKKVVRNICRATFGGLMCGTMLPASAEFCPKCGA